jgi:hypothetical protein
MKWMLLLVGMIFFVAGESSGQGVDSQMVKGILTPEGDTLMHVYLKPVFVTPNSSRNHREVEKYWRLARKVKKVWPFAQEAARLLQRYDAYYTATDDPKKRRAYVRQIEKQLFDEYGPQLKKLSISEGRILIKLIDRETHHTSYELIKDLKGGLTAFFWQGIARVFGNNLKDEYDPVTEDRMIEEIIFFIEMGVI